MKKKILSLVLIIAVVATISGYGYAERKAEPIRSAEGRTHKTYSESPALTQEDVDNNYQNYADESATYYFQEGKRTVAESVNCVGTVMDIESRIPVSGATIEFNGERKILTDQNGRFQIADLPAGEYNWIISADGYKDAKYLNMRIDNVGSSVVCFLYISTKREHISDHSDVGNHSEYSADDEIEKQNNGTDELDGIEITFKPEGKWKSNGEATATFKLV